MTFTIALFIVVGAGLIIAAPRPTRRRAFGCAALAQLTLLGWLCAHVGSVVDGRIRTERLFTLPWLGFAFDLRLDGLSLTMAFVVAIVGLAMCAYAAGYFPDNHPGSARLAGLSVLFSASMLGVVFADNIVLLYLAWLGMTLVSYALIGFLGNRRSRAAARKSLLITGIGGLALLAGLIVLAIETHSTTLSTILRSNPTNDAVTAVALLGVILGAATKSAQFPFHSWLPDAMEAPTPISAFLHASAMVKCGVYLIARFAILGNPTDLWRPVVLAIGIASMIYGGIRAVRERDLKVLLAFGTVSQLGMLFVLFGIGTPATDRAAWMELVAHAGFKAAMFMVVGIIERNTGTRTIGEIPPIGPGWTAVRVAAVVATASMVGIPLFAGSVGKEAAYAALLHASFTGRWLTVAAILMAACLTMAYGWRFVLATSTRRYERGLGRSEAAPLSGPVAMPRWFFMSPPVALALCGLALGIATPWVDDLAGVATVHLGTFGPGLHLEVFRGVGLPLAFSLTAYLVGTAWAFLGDGVSFARFRSARVRV